MKNTILKSLGLSFALLLGASASAQCLNVNGNMETFTAPIANTNVWINSNLTNWNVSHGTPSPGTVPSTNIWMWSYQNISGTLGEGIYTGFNFVAGETYELCYDVWRDGTSNPASEVHVEITNGLSPSAGGSFAIPNPVSQPLATQPWVGTGSWVTIVETFTAAANYSQLWFYPRLDAAPTPWQAACRIDNVCVKEVVTDPCDFEPRFETSYKEKCNVHFENITGIPAGFTILETYWDFGDGTTGTGMNVDHFYTTGGVYEVCMTVWMINEDGECCKKTVCERIDAPDCDPCELIGGAKIVATGSNPFTFTVTGLPAGLYSVLGYHWNFGDGTFGTGQTVGHTFATGGVKTICVTIYYYDAERKECCSVRVCIEVEARWLELVEDGRGKIDSPLKEGVNYEDGEIAQELENFNKIVISPNPNNGEFELRLKDGGSIETIHVYDQAGKLVYSTENTSTTNISRMNLNNLEKGMYLVTVNQANELKRSFEKVVIK